ncbi:MAG: ATP-dependent DNA helicase RecG [Syntrophomonas sp.]
MDKLFEKVQFLKGVGPSRSKQLGRLGIETIFDMFWYVPRSYFNRDKTDKIAALVPGDNVRIKATVRAAKQSRTPKGMNLFKAVLADDSGMVTAVWFNQPFLTGIIKPGQEIFLSGKLKNVYGKLEISVTYYEFIEDEDQKIGVLPVYPLTEGLSQKTIRNIISYALDNYLGCYPEMVNLEIMEKQQLCNIQLALKNIHFPESGEAYLQARRRLAFEELFLFQISVKQQKRLENKKINYIIHQKDSDLVQKIISNLPYQLTNAQQEVTTQIFNDMESSRQMNRLLQGDVGSGKTVVAALAMAKSISSGYQAALMAPTEILADQHYVSLNRFYAGTDVAIARLTGSTSQSERRIILDAAVSGDVDIIVGTQALIQDEISFSHLGLAVIDEQHRFGVRQRAVLSNKGTAPDVLVMTATPIPRTLALTAYGDLDLSVISELPPGRKPVKTLYLKKNFRGRAYEFLKQEIEKGAQAYIVCPLVEESEKQDLMAAVSLYDELQNSVFPGLKLGLLHGRMKSADKDGIMELFKQGHIQVLVSTTVIEVGVDVPNASLMVIEQAERFGLSQLHQLRGRVGRGSIQSYCLLIGDPKTEEAFRRLKAMEKTNDGFELAHEDLLLRGPGEFWGVKQHGLDLFKVADLVKDQELIELTRNIVNDMNLDEMPDIILALMLKHKFKRTNEIARN